MIRRSLDGGPREAKDERRAQGMEGAGKSLLEGSRAPERQGREQASNLSCPLSLALSLPLVAFWSQRGFSTSS